MTTDDRTLILNRIRQALPDIPADETPDDVLVPREYQHSHATGDLVELFATRVGDYRAGVTRTDAAGLPTTIARLLDQRAITTLVAPPGFPRQWLARATTVEVLADEPTLTVTQLDATAGVITTAALAIAETGTIILDAGPGQGRRALTLLPDYHLCIIQADQITQIGRAHV